MPDASEPQPAGAADAPQSVFAKLKLRLNNLFEEYGGVAIGTYFTIFGLTLLGFVFAIQMGWQVEGAAAGAGKLGAAYVATKLTQPIRIGATLVLTPLIARVVRRRKTGDVAAADSDEPGDAAGSAVDASADE